MQRVVVNIVSDTICPWCFVGKRRFDRGSSGIPAEIQVRWRPFFLDSTLPTMGVDKMGRYTEKLGAERVKQMLPMMQKVGEGEGIKFDYGGKISNTILSHALLELAYDQGGAEMQGSLVEALFSFYFEQQGNLGDIVALRTLCERVGLKEGIEEIFDGSSSVLKHVVEEEREWRRRYSVSGVPFFVIEGVGAKPILLSGAQEAAVINKALRGVLGST